MKYFYKFIVFLIVIAMFMTMTVFADDEQGAFSEMQEQSITANNVVIIGANPSEKTEYTGSGSTNTKTQQEVKTPEQIANEEIQEMLDVIENIQDVDPAEEQFNPDDVLAPVELPEYELENFELPSFEELEDMSGFDLGDHFTIDNDVTHDNDKLTGITVWGWENVTNPDGTTSRALVSRTNYTLTLDALKALADRYHGLNLDWNFIDDTTPANVFQGTPGKTYDTPNGDLNSNADARAQYERDMQNMMDSYNAPLELPPYENFGNLENGLYDYFGESNLKPFIIGGTTLGRPLSADQLREALYSYINLYKESGQNYITLSKMEIYHATSYHLNTIRIANPVYPTRFRWSVLSPSGAQIVDSVTQDPNEKVMFTSPGSYFVNVWQDKEVTRINKVSGYKSEIWSLANGDQFDGLIFYAHKSYFESNCSDDLGTQIEELQLTDDSFHANVTENMLGKVQFIDQYGGIHQVQNDFTTERIG